jgi:hypothetical protein
MATDTASADAMIGSGMTSAKVTPTNADSTLPPSIDHGCASGLVGVAKSSTADAPIGAIKRGRLTSGPSASLLTSPVSTMPINAPKHARIRSSLLIDATAGMKRLKVLKNIEN